MYDVIIIGAGVSGAATARELSRYKIKACVIEKEEDVCCGTSKANSALVHAGYDATEGSLKAKLNVRGNQMMEQLSRDLDFPFKKNGSLVVCLHEEDMPNLQALYNRGIANGVKELRILNREELKEMEPNISDQAYAALYAPTAGIVCPFGMNMAMAENKGKAYNLGKGVNKKREEAYRELLRPLNLGLEDKLHVKVGALSGGQRQAMSLLMSTMTPLDFLILDEHTAALDPKTAEINMRLTDQIVREKKLTSIMVTHNLRYAIEYGTRIVMMHQGKVILDKKGEEKKNMNVDDVLDLFNEISIECGN